MEIIFLHHKVACRNCLSCEDSIIDFTGDSLKNYHSLTEYEVMNELKDFYKQAGKRCICGSDNLEPVNINLNGNYALYDYDRSVKYAKENNLRLIQFNIDKSNLGVYLKIGCPEGRPDNKFLKQSLGFVMSYICKITRSEFISHDRGNLFISLLGKIDSSRENYEFKIESLTFAGLTRDEIYYSLEEPFIKVY